MSRKVRKIFKRFVKGKDKDAFVENAKVFVGTLPYSAFETLLDSYVKVVISSRVLKHAYDKRPAQEFDFFLRNLGIIIKFPSCIYKNKSGKRGSFCLI